MTGLLYTDEQTEKAIAFCWDTNKMIHTARFNAWAQPRIAAYLESRRQLWRRFSSGVRSSAHFRFMDELQDELRKPAEQRNPLRPVWLHEQLGMLNSDDAGNNENGLEGLQP